MAEIKICGLTTPETLEASIEAGARFVGFVFYPPSPRHITPDAASTLAKAVPKGVRRVGLFVDPSNKELEKTLSIVPLDMVQLHGEETPARVQEVKTLTGKPVMKAIRMATKYDLEDIEDYENAADWLLFDSRPKEADLPGGTGQSFDWSILKGLTFKKPWMLSGGLSQDNVSDALSLLNPKVVDVSSGVESDRGIKDSEKIKNFINEVKSND